MMPTEYIVLVMTFLCILFIGITTGILFGIVAATATFVVMYSRLEVFSINKRKLSPSLRTYEEREVLLTEQGKILTMRFRGYIFFGSAMNLIAAIKKHIKTSSDPEMCGHDVETGNAEHAKLLQHTRHTSYGHHHAETTNQAEYVILDFTDVRRIDSTAARGCFFMFATIMRELRTVELIFAGLSPSTLEILRSNGVVYDGDHNFENLNEALYYCEEKILKRFLYATQLLIYTMKYVVFLYTNIYIHIYLCINKAYAS